MRIICDYCGGGISGRVQRVADNLNFHPECLGEVIQGQDTTAITTPGHSDRAKRSTDRFPSRGMLPLTRRRNWRV